MKFQLVLENISGDRIDMTTTANQYMTSEIDGLYPPDGTISTSTYAGSSVISKHCIPTPLGQHPASGRGRNGSYLNNAFIEKRNIVISFQMRGVDIEKRRHALYRVVKPSRYIKIYYRTANIDVYTEGYVESCTVNNFAALTSGQISILCPDPYWYSTNSTYAYYSQITGAFHFPFPETDAPFPLGIYSRTNNISVVNSGDEVGFTIQFEALEDGVKTPTLYDADTGEYLQIRTEMQRGDVITITTKTGNKTVNLTRNGVDCNLINCLVAGSTWLMLREGENHFHVQAQRNVKYLRVTLIHTNAYLGV